MLSRDRKSEILFSLNQPQPIQSISRDVFLEWRPPASRWTGDLWWKSVLLIRDGKRYKHVKNFMEICSCSGKIFAKFHTISFFNCVLSHFFSLLGASMPFLVIVTSFCDFCCKFSNFLAFHMAVYTFLLSKIYFYTNSVSVKKKNQCLPLILANLNMFE